MPTRPLVTDPVLTNFSIAFWQERDVVDTGSGFGMTGRFIAPVINIQNNNSFKYVQYNLRNAFQRPASLRAPKTEYPKVSWNYTTATDYVEDRGYLDDWDDEEATA